MAVKTYSLKKDGNTNLSANFKVKEFACKDGSDKILIDTTLVTFLQKIRDWAKAAVTINSAYRSESHNKKVKGASKSKHLYGEAADIGVSGKTPAEVAKFAESIGVLGVGCYGGSAGSFVHIDTRTSKYFWTNTGSGDKAVSTHGGTAPTTSATTTPTATTSKTFKEGDIITFAGGYHYGSSNETKATGGTRTAGTAKITKINSSAKHPYHLIGVKSNVYGWVDANLIK